MYIADLDLIESVGHNINDIKMVNTILPVIFDGGVKNCEGFEFSLIMLIRLLFRPKHLKVLMR